MPGGSPDSENPPPPELLSPGRHLAYVEDRLDKEAEEILDEAIQTLRDRRKRGEIVF